MNDFIITKPFGIEYLRFFCKGISFLFSAGLSTLIFDLDDKKF